MRNMGRCIALALLVTFIATSVMAGGHGAKSALSQKVMNPDGAVLNLSGHILDNHKEPIAEAEVLIVVDGVEMDRIVTASNGHYISRFELESKQLETSTIHVKARKTSFGTRLLKFKGIDLARKGSHYFFSQDIVMPRILEAALLLSQGGQRAAP